MTEEYRSAWEDRDVPYLVSLYDGEPGLVYCDTRDRELLSQILPGFDLETQDFYRWTVTYSPEEIRQLVKARLDEDLGPIVATGAAVSRAGRTNYPFEDYWRTKVADRRKGTGDSARTIHESSVQFGVRCGTVRLGFCSKGNRMGTRRGTLPDWSGGHGQPGLAL